MRFQFHDYFCPNVTGTRKLFQKFWTTKFHQSEFGRQEPSTKRGSWDGHTQILTCFWPPFYNHNVWKLSAHFFMTFHGYCSFTTMGWNRFWRRIPFWNVFLYITLVQVRDIHIECSKQFKWNSYFYLSGQNQLFLAALKLL